MSHEIDLVIPWVDGADEAWLHEKQAAIGVAPDGGAVRFRDWDNLQYVFRGVETFLPFIRTVHFITWGHLPSWINPDCEKLHIVRHSEYIPAEYLPTFNANTIEMNIHRIDGLAEHFIYANDDMFFLQPLTADFFFQNGKPVDCCIENPLQFYSGMIDHIIGNDLAVINKHFSKKETLRKHRKQWYSLKNSKGALKNRYMAPFACFTGFYDPHLPFAYCKDTFRAIWEAEPTLLDTTCRHRLRTAEDVNQWLCRYWQFVTGNFVPVSQRGQFFSIGRDNAAIAKAITHQQFPMICLNDDDPTMDFETEKQTLRRLFEEILPNKSAFEK